MNDIIIRIEAPEIARAIANLAGALSVFGVALEESSKNKKTVDPVPVDILPQACEAEKNKESYAGIGGSPVHHTIEEVRAAWLLKHSV